MAVTVVLCFFLLCPLLTLAAGAPPAGGDVPPSPAGENVAIFLRAAGFIPGPVGLWIQSISPFLLAALALWQTHSHHKLKTIDRQRRRSQKEIDP